VAPSVYLSPVGNKRYELSNHLGNVMTVISDKITPIDTTNDGLWDYFNPSLVSATDYYPFGMGMPGRGVDRDQYKYGFNGQENEQGISEFGDHTTATFWEFDPRLGRRWNLDPKPDPSLSNYSTFKNSPVWINDPAGDTTYLYNRKGTYLGMIADKLSSNEIVIVTEFVANMANKYTEKANVNIANAAATAVRKPQNNIARITRSTIRAIGNNWSNNAESTGLLYVDPTTHQVLVWTCPDCPSRKIGSDSYETDIEPLRAHSETLGKSKEIIGFWHTHPVDQYYDDLNPTDWDKDATDITRPSDVIGALRGGGIGIVGGSSRFVIHGLADHSRTGIDRFPLKDNGTSTGGINMFRPGYKQYTSQSISPHK